jgi:trehalose 6-phosphate phosphatase
MSTGSVKIKRHTIGQRDTDHIPSVFEKGFTSVFPANMTPVLFFDFDGTLSPIVRHPEDATLSDEMRRLLKKCASEFITAIVSGRDLDDVKKRVNLNEVIYAGSHGFHISGPGGLFMEHEQTESILPVLDRIERSLVEEFSGGPKGVQVERKRYAIAVHYRNADVNSTDEIKNKIKTLLQEFSGIRTGRGKKIIEIKPDIDWHKGRAIKWILEYFNLWDNPEILPVYFGDDITDEDAFKTIINKGAGILVGSHGNPSLARYKLKDIDEVKAVLYRLTKR